GGLIGGAVLVPLLGTGRTCHLLAGIAVLAIVPAIGAGLVPVLKIPRWLACRASPSFPFVRTTWALVLVASVTLVGTTIVRRSAEHAALQFEEQELAEVSGSASFERKYEPFPHAIGSGGATAPARTVSLSTMAVAADVNGFGGPINLLVSLDENGKLRGIRYIESNETPSYVEGIDDWLATLEGRELKSGPLNPDNVDVVSGASITGRACLESINRAAVAGSLVAFGASLVGNSSTADAQSASGTGTSTGTGTGIVAGTSTGATKTITGRTVAIGILLLLFFPVFLLGRRCRREDSAARPPNLLFRFLERNGAERLRLAYQAIALLVLGFACNTAITEVDLASLSLGKLPSFAANPGWVLLACFVVLTSLLWGQVYCGYVCPFGALQELASRLGRWIGLRGYVHEWLDVRMRYWKYVLLVIMMVAFWVTGERSWVELNPMQRLFHGQLGRWQLASAVVGLIGALFFFRFWCRYFCPMGAFLALANKLAILGWLAPRRSIERCDLGVRSEHDIDCLRCNRCIAGTDIGMRRRNAPTPAPSCAVPAPIHSVLPSRVPLLSHVPRRWRQPRFIALVLVTGTAIAGTIRGERLRYSQDQVGMDSLSRGGSSSIAGRSGHGRRHRRGHGDEDGQGRGPGQGQGRGQGQVGRPAVGPGQGGWRAVDQSVLTDKLREGTVVRHQAEWYHVVESSDE
ncbi:MAG: 4Fe-4S binding protein, partial [Pseudomonadota bacterium]